MNLSPQQLWDRFQRHYSEYPELGLALDLSRMNISDEFLTSMEPRMQKAFAAMAELEKGAISNPDEKRMVGHYWLRNPALSPSGEIRTAIEQTVQAIQQFAADVHSGRIKGSGGVFKNLLLIGIGGSALGPQFVSRALENPATDKMQLFTFDNTDPDGMDLVLAKIGKDLNKTLCVVVSKSGGTKETRNGMLEAKAAYEAAGLNFGSHSVAITQVGSELDKFAVGHNWIKEFPMWDWVGGRTSELSAVGLLPAALQGLDIQGLLAGAKACDVQTRKSVTSENPAALLSLAWFASGNGKGEKAMVVLPYKDRLELFSKYLQQLVMESLGKAEDVSGKTVHQGIYVFGNKGSTDQHAYVQQLRDGLSNFFVTFIEVLQDRMNSSIEVEASIRTGDYLNGFLLGTRRALFENVRESLTITVKELNAFSVGALIALFERAVGFYASLININAYHQPGVEAGKKAASEVIRLQLEIQKLFAGTPLGTSLTAEAISKKLSNPDVEAIFKLCQHLAASASSGISRSSQTHPGEVHYTRK